MRATLFAACLFLALGAPTFAASPDEAATDLSTEIISPFCPGVTLHECPSAEATRLRDRIESWFRDGMTREEILVTLESEYGSGVRASPSPSGMGLAAWLGVGAGVMLALGTGAVLVRKWSHKETDDREEPSPIDATERRRLDEELARLRTQS